MRLVYTDGANRDFVALCAMLDENLNEIVGGEKQRKHFMQYNLLDDIHDVYIGYIGDAPVACGSFKAYDRETAEIKRVFVRKEYRGRKIAERLMAALERKAREKGYRSLILETGRLLTAAIGLYTKIGFRVIENYGPYREMNDCVCMKKELGL